MLIGTYRKRLAILVVQMARDDPQWVKHVVTRLREEPGDIEAADLAMLDRMADDWIQSSARRQERHLRRRR